MRDVEFNAFLELVKRVYPLNASETPPTETPMPQRNLSVQGCSKSVSLRPKKRARVYREIDSDSDFE